MSGFGRIGGGRSAAGFDGERGADMETGSFIPSFFNGEGSPALIPVKAGRTAVRHPPSEIPDRVSNIPCLVGIRELPG